MFPTLQIADDSPDTIEQLGTKPKYWFRYGNSYFLFKIGRPNTGENWAEVIAAELAGFLGLPHAHYDFAIWKEQKGVWSPGIIPKGGRLVLGNELLAAIHPNYPAENLWKVKDHTLSRIHVLLRSPQIGLPPEWRPPASGEIKTAFDLFLGYLLFDAWIANQDRHHENWGLINHQNGLYLAPTFDHAASMGQNETDEKRQQRLTTKDSGFHISSYVKKSKSATYAKSTDAKPLLTLELFAAAANKSPAAARFWLQQLAHIEQQQITTLFTHLTEREASAITKQFAQEMLRLNQQRLLELQP